MPLEEIKLEGTCYVLLQTNAIHPIAYLRHYLLWYPERSLGGYLNQINYKSYVKSIVTECPWIIACYDRRDVKIWDIELGRWETADRQTYGASVDSIHNMLGIHQTIPSTPYDGGDAIEKLTKELEKSYKKADKKYLKHLQKCRDRV